MLQFDAFVVENNFFQICSGNSRVADLDLEMIRIQK
jgi:hypothetical protein